jgi:major membrane immunogen (membrane-anchored lipoprotein)
MIKKLGLVSITAVLLLSGCGNSSKKESSFRATEVSQMSGFWDVSYDKDGKHDEVYEYYFQNGEIIIYDYQKDTFDGGKDCYNIGQSVQEIRKGAYKDTLQYYDTKTEKSVLTFNAVVSDSKLVLSDPFDPTKTIVYPRANKSRVDMEAKMCPKESKNKILKR